MTDISTYLSLKHLQCQKWKLYEYDPKKQKKKRKKVQQQKTKKKKKKKKRKKKKKKKKGKKKKSPLAKNSGLQFSKLYP